MKTPIAKSVFCLIAFGISLSAHAASSARLQLSLNGIDNWNAVANDILKVNGVEFVDYGLENEITEPNAEVTFEYDEVEGFSSYVDGQEGTVTGSWTVEGIHHKFTCKVPESLEVVWTCNLSVSAIVPSGTLAGSGTEEDPFQLYSADDLIVWSTNSATYASDAFYRLADDITIDAETAATLLPLFPTSSAKFAGTFDGDYYKITYAFTSDNAIAGLFGYAQNATFKNLVVDGTVSVSSSSEMYNCAILVVEASGNMMFDNITTEGSISGDKVKNVGGVCMYCAPSSTQAAVFSNCTNKAALTTTYTKAAGILCYSGNYGAFSFNGCGNEGTITSDGIDGVGYLGGIIGWASHFTSMAFTNCSNSGAISCTRSSLAGHVSIAGIAGLVSDAKNPNAFDVVGCSNSGSVTVLATAISSPSEIGGIGGIVGRADNSLDEDVIALKDCSNTGVIAIDNDSVDISAYELVGSLVGRSSGVSVTRAGMVTAQASMFPMGFNNDAYSFATVEDGVATFCDPAAGGSYKVMLGGAAFELATAGATITLDETLTNATVTVAASLADAYNLKHVGNRYSLEAKSPIPTLPENPTATDVTNAINNITGMSDANKTKLQNAVAGSDGRYNEFRTWIAGCACGQDAAVATNHVVDSFLVSPAVAAESYLFANEPVVRATDFVATNVPNVIVTLELKDGDAQVQMSIAKAKLAACLSKGTEVTAIATRFTEDEITATEQGDGIKTVTLQLAPTGFATKGFIRFIAK